MKKNIHSSIALVAALIMLSLVGCTNHSFNIDNFNWLDGNWKVADEPVYEVWENNAAQLTGTTFVIEESDTFVFEYLRIYCNTNDSCFYEAKVPEQNDGKPILFSIIEATDSSFVAVNPLHDYPQKVRYTMIAQSKIEVLISTIDDQKPQSFLFEKSE